MRRFRTQGRVYPDRHYVVSRTEEVADFIDRIEDGRYIALFAPRQTGKTTFFHLALETLTTKDTTYFPIQLNFEGYEEYTALDFYASFYREVEKEIKGVFQKRKEAPPDALIQFLTNTTITDHISMRDFFQGFAEHLASYYNTPQRVVLFIDVFHGIPLVLENSFLASLRYIFLSNEPRCIHSVCFVSVISIIQRDMVNAVSPFNVQDAFHLHNFTPEQVHELLMQYTEEGGQVFAPEVIKAVHKQTAGQPFLVNRLAQILTEEMDILKTEPITMTHFSEARARILQEHNTNFEHLLSHIHRDLRFESILMRIVSHSDRGVFFNRHDERIDGLTTNGVISKGNHGVCQIANPIYFDYIRQVLSTYLEELEQKSCS